MLRSALVGLAMLAGLGLAGLSLVHFEEARAVDAAVPVPVYMVAQIKLPRRAYIEAAKALQGADPNDGGALLARAEAEVRSGRPASEVVPLLQAGLRLQPASARGWTLLAEALQGTDRKLAGKSLSQALILAPRDFYLARARAEDAAALWSDLDSDTRAAALSQVRLIWQEPSLRDGMRDLAGTHAGTILVTQALDQDGIRSLNRWLRERQSAL